MPSFRSSLTRAISAARFLSIVGRNGVPCAGLTSPVTTGRPARTDIFGFSQRLQFLASPVLETWNPSRSFGARSKLKRRKDSTFDNIVQREKKVRIVNKIKGILLKQPGRTMTLLHLGMYRRDFGLTGRRRVIVLLNKFPGMFEVYKESGNVMYVRFTAEAEAQYEEELKLKDELEIFLVEKVRKLLMMSVNKRVNLDKIAHIKNDLGLPEDFKTSLVPNYPQYFTMVDTENGTALELNAWDPLLAVSAAKKKAVAEVAKEDDSPKLLIDGEEIVSTALSSRKLQLPKGLNLTKKERMVAVRFQQQPYVSPYSDATDLDPASLVAEKRACAVVHEILSLTLEKKTLVDHLTHFKTNYKFSQSIRAVLIRHPEMFYVSFRGHRDSVFLREAYDGSELIDKDPQILARERLRELVHVRRDTSKPRVIVEGAEDVDEHDGVDSELDDASDEEYEDEEGDSDDESGGREGKVSEIETETAVRSFTPSPRRLKKTDEELEPRANDHRIQRKEVAMLDRPGE